ncbi:MAG: hypothetical protein NC205_00480 [Prevotella sp.]|nr:hypothetical protein [Alistipes senegalensis]MCM1357038.1 hypothetical protein [Prevotella sp.]MCM1473234.1 hypothetical protein [Muribaculaceae bacterium]
MASSEKIIKLVETISDTNINVEEFATLLSLMGKLDSCDIVKVVWSAIGTANALSSIKNGRND